MPAEPATFALLSDRDLGYVAGLIEGEGSIDLHRDKYPRVRVSMTDRDTVGKIADVWGTSVRLTLAPRPHKPIWTTELQGATADAFLRAILPCMGARRSQQIAGVLSAGIAKRTAARVDLHRPPLLAAA